MNQVGKRYTRELTIAMVVYALMLVLMIALLQRDLPTIARYGVALLPVFPIAYGLRAYASFLRGIDELQQRIQLDGLAFAVGGAGLFIATWSFLEFAGVPKLPTVWVFPILIGFWGIGTALATRRFQ